MGRCCANLELILGVAFIVFMVETKNYSEILQGAWG